MPLDSHRSGLLAAGNFIIDQVKIIDHWPQQDALASILEYSEGNGGGPYNILKNLAIAGVDYPLAAAGLLGDDAAGQRIIDDLRQSGVDTDALRTTKDAPTSYTDVMTAADSGRRTFFHQKGSNALLDVEDFDFSKDHYRLFYLGYLGLLDRLDSRNGNGKSRFAEVLEHAKSVGMTTVADAVTTDRPDFEDIVSATLKRIDILILNEWEAGKATRRQLMSSDGIPDRSEIQRAARDLFNKGNPRAIVIHMPEGAYALTCHGEEIRQGSVRLNPSEIRGSVGAGDAFCAGMIHGVHEGYELEKSMLLATSFAAASLRAATTSGGIMPIQECLDWAADIGFRDVL